MGKLTGTRHGDAANELVAFYREKFRELSASNQYFMAAVALAMGLEAAVLAYLLIEFGEEDGSGDRKIRDSVSLAELIEAANNLEVLSAPINTPSHAREDARPPSSVAKDAADKIKSFRRMIHPARALKESFDPRTFTIKQLAEVEDLFDSVVHSLLYNL